MAEAAARALARALTKALAPESLSLERGEERGAQASRRDAAAKEDAWMQSVARPRAAGDPAPGDLVLLATAGQAYALGRRLTGQSHDHVVVVLERQRALHISPPVIRTLALETVLRTSRHPRIIRPRISARDRDVWLAQLEEMLGKEYSLAQLFRAMARLAAGSALPSLAKTPFRAEGLIPPGRICTNAILTTLLRSSPRVAAALRELDQRLDYNPANEASGSLEDFVVLQRCRPDLFAHVECIEVGSWDGPERRQVASWASGAGIEHVFVLRTAAASASPHVGAAEQASVSSSVVNEVLLALGSLRRFGMAGTLMGFAQSAASVLVSERDWQSLTFLLRSAQMALLPFIDLDTLKDRFAQLAREYPALPAALYAGCLLFALGHIRTLLRLAWRAIQLAILRRALLEAWAEVQRSRGARVHAKL